MTTLDVMLARTAARYVPPLSSHDAAVRSTLSNEASSFAAIGVLCTALFAIA